MEEYYEAVNQENTGGDKMLKRDLRNIKRQNTEDLLKAWIDGVKVKKDSRMTHNISTIFFSNAQCSPTSKANISPILMNNRCASENLAEH